VTVADTGLGFGKAATAGTGVGLANIRERLQLLLYETVDSSHRATGDPDDSSGRGTVLHLR
jgi:sensor histidine kinase YesM